MAKLKHQYQCCFCGHAINESAVDPCALVVVGNWAGPQPEQAEQQFFCHIVCFKNTVTDDLSVEIEEIVTGRQN
jgi:hypothetical protein